MGCDIHAAVERQQRPSEGDADEWWTGVIDCGRLPRNYLMFACLVDGHGRDAWGVGGVAPERGLPPEPSDIAREVKYYQESRLENPYAANAVCYADHTFSWLTAPEYRAALDRYREFAATLKGWTGEIDPEWLGLAVYLDFMAQHGDVRLVIGFDN